MRRQHRIGETAKAAEVQDREQVREQQEMGLYMSMGRGVRMLLCG